MLCLFSIYLLNCLVTKDATIIYAHSIRKESEAQTGQVPQRERRSHHLGSDTRAGGLITQLCPCQQAGQQEQSCRGCGLEKQSAGHALGATPCLPPTGMSCLQSSQAGLLQDPGPWVRGVDYEVAIIALVIENLGAVEILHLCPWGSTCHEDPLTKFTKT